jgi:hypothetical protein
VTLRVVCFFAGLALAGTGALLAREEAMLVEARHVARDGYLARPGTPVSAIRKAYADVAAIRPGDRGELELAIELYGRGGVGGGEMLIARQARVERAAANVARKAPLDAKAWCVLALAHSKTAGLTPPAVDMLRTCYALGPREIGVVNGRLMLVLEFWDALPQDVRNAAMIDVAAALGEPGLGPWMVQRLAYAVAAVAPAREPLVVTLLDTYGENLKPRYEQAVSALRRQAMKRAAVRQERR